VARSTLLTGGVGCTQNPRLLNQIAKDDGFSNGDRDGLEEGEDRSGCGDVVAWRKLNEMVRWRGYN
jgi:hypothetical protein